MGREYTLGLYEKSMPSCLDWKEKLEAACEAGFDFIEISIDETDEKLKRLDMSRQERLELICLMEKTGIPIRTLCLSGHRKYPLGSSNPQTREKAMEIMEKAIWLAESLGIRIIQLAGYDVYYEESNAQTKEYFLENLKRATEMAASAGVILGFETMETDFMNTVEKAMKYVSIVSSAYLNVYPDIGNITNASREYGTNVLEDLQRGKGHLTSMHLKETVPGIFREVPFGTGHVDFEAAIRAAWELGVRKYVAEFWYTGNPGWREELAAVNRRFKGILDRRAGRKRYRTFADPDMRA